MTSSPSQLVPRRVSVLASNNNAANVNLGKPRLKLVRCTVGSLVISIFAILPDIYLLYFNTTYAFTFSIFKGMSLSGYDRYALPVSFIAFISTVFSIIFTISILCVSSLTMKKQKRLKIAPYMIFAVFKISLLFLRGDYRSSAGFLIKDILLYLCMSNTAKNILVRKLFKPYKQVISYD